MLISDGYATDGCCRNSSKNGVKLVIASLDEATQLGVANEHRAGLLHFVRNDGEA